MQTLHELRQRGATVIVSTHRTGLLQVVDKVMLLNDGRIQVFDDRDKVVRPVPTEPVREERLQGETNAEQPQNAGDQQGPQVRGEGTNG
jgi:ABC-type protease/lipase transport system fused ATPase/permease subunit